MSDTPESLAREFEHFSSYSSTPAKANDLVERARSKCPVPHSNELGGFHLFMNFEDVRKGLLDWRTYSSTPSSLRPYVEGTPVMPPNSFDPPLHTTWRKVFSDGVNARAAERIEPEIRADTIRFIEDLAERGECDLHLDLAEKVPMNVIFHILGLEREHHEEIRRMSMELLATVDDIDRFTALFHQFAEYGLEEVNKRRSDPREDYLTVLAQATLDGRPMAPDEIGAAVISLLLAGHGTATASITNLFYEVLRRPDLKQRLIDNPQDIPKAVEEGLRLHHPFLGLYRTATVDHELHGSQIKAGDSILMGWYWADRDPAVLDNPLEFDIDRPAFNHLGFGIGKHSCVGAPVARMEMRVVMEELLARLPDIELIAPEKVQWDFHGAETLGFLELPARFTPRPRRDT